jgi:hypothetical protein
MGRGMGRMEGGEKKGEGEEDYRVQQRTKTIPHYRFRIMYIIWGGTE